MRSATPGAEASRRARRSQSGRAATRRRSSSSMRAISRSRRRVGAETPAGALGEGGSETAALGSPEFEELGAPGREFGELPGVGPRQGPGLGPHVPGEAGEHPGVEAVGLGQDAEGLGVSADALGLDAGDGDSGVVEGGEGGTLVASGGFEDDEPEAASSEQTQERLDPLGGVGKATLGSRQETEVEGVLGDVDAGEDLGGSGCVRVRHGSILAMRARRGAVPSDCADFGPGARAAIGLRCGL